MRLLHFSTLLNFDRFVLFPMLVTAFFRCLYKTDFFRYCKNYEIHIQNGKDVFNRNFS